MTLFTSLLKFRISHLAFSSAFFLWGCSDLENPSTDKPHILTIKVKPLVESQSYQSTEHYIGRIEAGKSSRLGFDLGGELVHVNVEEGDQVTANQALARLNIERLNAAESQFIAQVQQAQVQLKLAQTTLDRTLNAYKFDGVSIQQRDETQQAYDQAKAALALANAQLQRIKIDIWQSTIKAPYNGTIIQRFVDEGEIVSAGQPVLHIQQAGKRKARIGVSSNHNNQWSIGSEYTLDVDGSPTAATLTAIVPTLDPITKTIDLLFELRENTSIEPGALVRFSYVKTIKQTGFWVSLDVLTTGNRGLWNLLIAVADKNNSYRLEQRVISILYQQGERVFVTGALSSGELLVAGGIHRVVPNQLVYILQD